MVAALRLDGGERLRVLRRQRLVRPFAGGAERVVGEQAVAPKLGTTAETLRKWVRQAERDAGQRPGLTTSERERLKELEREVRELKRTNEILKTASAFFAQAALDRRTK
jgi:transposase